jgi:predicted nucleic acid-binding protein
MRDFLLDTNIWSYWFDPENHSEQHANIKEQFERLPSSARLSISVISWGEIDYGYNVNRKKEESRETEFRKFISNVAPWLVSINIHTAEIYGKLRAQLFEEYASKKKMKRLRPEQLIDLVTSLELGIQENDLWIAAQAISRNLTLVTNDAMEHIREVAGESLHVDNWAVKP